MDGVAAAARIRAAFPKIEIVLYAHRYSETVISEALQAGAKAFVLKSDAAQSLIEAMDALRFGRRYFSPGVSRPFLERISNPRVQAMHQCLTPRETEVLQLIAQGCTNQEVGNRAI